MKADCRNSPDGNGGNPVATGLRAPGTRPDWLALSHRQQRRMRAEKIRHAEKAAEARPRPGSNVRPISDADVDAYRQRLRADIGKLLDRAQIIQPEEQRLVQELIISRHAYQGSANIAEAALGQILAMVDHHEQMRLGDTTLKEQRAFEP